MNRMDRIRERIEAVINNEYMHDNGLTPNEVVFFIFDILKSEGVIIESQPKPNMYVTIPQTIDRVCNGGII